MQTVNRYSLLIGKKRMNLSNYSGISYAGCDKIYEDYSIVLPGGYILPIAFCIEQIYLSERSPEYAENDQKQILERMDSYLLDHTVSAEILNRNVITDCDQDACRFRVQYVSISARIFYHHLKAIHYPCTFC